MDDEQELLELEEEQEVVETVEDDGVKPISLSPDSIATDTVPNIINHYLSKVRFGFYITKINKSGTSGKRNYTTVGFQDLMQNENTSVYFSSQTIDLYNKVISEGDINSLGLLIASADDDMNTRTKQVEGRRGVLDQPIEGSAKGSSVYVYAPKKEDQVDVAEILNDIDKTINSDDFAQARENEARAEERQDILEVYQEDTNVYRTSHPYWGYKTTVDGMITSVLTGEEVPAPFAKGSEFRNFIGMDPSDVFRLQRRMVAAGMDAPLAEEYGQWSKREADFMSAIYIKATDSGNWEKDLQANRPMYETTLAELEEQVGQTEDFVRLLQEADFLGKQTSITNAEKKALLDQAAEQIGIKFTAQDYVDFAQDVIEAYGLAAKQQKDYEDALITDRDLILNAEIKDPRAIQPGEFPLFLPGSSLPIVIPSYETLRAEKGELPQVQSPLEIIVQTLEQRDEIKGEVAAVEDLDAIKYATNIFEASLGQIDL